MEPLDDGTTFVAQTDTDHLTVEVGDAKQAEFFPRIKFAKWDNEANVSLGLADTEGEHRLDGDTILFDQPGRTTRFYDQRAPERQPLTSIRRVVAGDAWEPLQATAEYEMFNHIGTPGEMLFAHYTVPEPTIAVFDLMPAGLHLDVGDDGYARDFDYDDKSAYHPADVPIPSLGRARLVRYYTPVNENVNPMFMDSGLHNMDCQWHGTDLDPDDVLEAQMHAIEVVLERYGVELEYDLNRPTKLFFRHGDRLVKCYSGQPEDGGLYSYLNIGCAYNKAFDFYRPEVDKSNDIRSDFAYGIAVAYPNVTHAVMDEIAVEFARLLDTTITDRPYDETERVQWQRTQQLQDDIGWLRDGIRRDANWWLPRTHDGLEFEVVLHERPATNTIGLTANVPKRLVALHQGPLPYGQGRPHDVHGSFALYHESERNNDYTTGKVGHLFRPIAFDSAGLSCFCDFAEAATLTDGEHYDLRDGLTVVIPQWFLDEAVYPVVIDPTLGYTTAGGSALNIGDASNEVRGEKLTPTTRYTVDSLVAYCDMTGNGDNLTTYPVIYATDGTLLKAGTSQGVHPTAQWFTFTGFSNQVLLRNVQRVVGVASDQATCGYGACTPRIYYDANSGKTESHASATMPPPASVTLTDTSNTELSAYLNLTESVVAPIVTTDSFDTYTDTSVKAYGTVTDDGGADVTERGFCYGTSANPTTAGSKVTASGTTGAYNAVLTNLTRATLYHVRAYAITSQGTSYGADKTFFALANNTYLGSYKATIDHTQCGATDSTSFPVLLRVTLDDLKDTAHGGLVYNTVSSHGQTIPADLAFFTNVDLTTGLMPFEIVRWVNTTGELEAWVQVATLSHTTDTVFYMGVGNGAKTTDLSGFGTGTKPWDINFNRVFHLEGNSKDSSTLSRDGTDTSMSYGTAYGDIGQGAHFAGSSYNNSSGELQSVGDVITWSAWVKYTATTSKMVVISTCIGNSQNICEIATDRGGTTGKLSVILSGISGTIATVTSPSAYNDGNWHHVAVTYDTNGGNGNVKLYVDGTKVADCGASTPTGYVWAVAHNTYVGHSVDTYFGGQSNWSGDIDEVHMGQYVARSADWILSEYNNQKPNQTFVTLLSLAPSTYIKAIEGLAKASVKAIEGLAIASVKAIEGLA